MPELPEVETIVRGLRKKVTGRTITGLWTDWWKYFKNHRKESDIKHHIIDKRIENVTRRAKNILFHLSDNHLLLIHQKLSGHLMFGKWIENSLSGEDDYATNMRRVSETDASRTSGFSARKSRDDAYVLHEKWLKHRWLPEPFKGPLTEPMNRFIRLLFFLDDGNMIAFSDIRRFGKVLCGPEEEIMNLPDLKDLGPEPLDRSFTLEKLIKLFKNKRGPIKQLILDQAFIVGIGNIYADEILWRVKLHPLTRAEKLKPQKIKELYSAIREILTHAVKLRGSSVGDYRDSSGREGSYEKFHNAYQKTSSPCPRCKTPIKRIKIGPRSAHFCPKCQKIDN